MISLQPPQLARWLHLHTPKSVETAEWSCERWPHLHTSGWLGTPRLPHGTPQHRTPWAPATVRAPPRLRDPRPTGLLFIQTALREADIACSVQVDPYTRFTVLNRQLPRAPVSPSAPRPNDLGLWRRASQERGGSNRCPSRMARTPMPAAHRVQGSPRCQPPEPSVVCILSRQNLVVVHRCASAPWHQSRAKPH